MTSARRLSIPTGSAGVTLVELMIVLVVIAIGILALSGVQTRSSTDVYTTGRRTRALAVAQTQIEVARSMGYTAAVSDSGQTDGFNWKTLVTADDVDLNRVTVQVNWLDKGTPDSVRVMDLLSQR